MVNEPRGFLGVLGGMGPVATADFLMKLAIETPAQRDQDHFSTIVYSDPSTPDRSDAILGIGPNPLPAVLQGIDFLNDAGVDGIAIPCNSAHFWYSKIAERSRVPVLHIVDSVAHRIRKEAPALRTVGVMSTDGTAHARLYRRLTDFGIGVFDFTDMAEDSPAMIGIRRVKEGRLSSGRDILLQAAERLVSRGAEGIVFGCTDISAAMGGENVDGVTVPTWDSAVSLAKASVDFMVGIGHEG